MFDQMLDTYGSIEAADSAMHLEAGIYLALVARNNTDLQAMNFLANALPHARQAWTPKR